MKIIQSSVWLVIGLLFFSQCSLLRQSGNSMDDLSSREYTLRMNIVDYADNYQGTKYTYAGRDPRKGFDCSGFTYFVMKKYGVELSPSSRLQEKQGRNIRVKDVKPGDLIFYRRSPLGRVFHVSLVYANDPDGIKVIHSTSRGVVIDNITTSSYWAPKISTARDVVSR
jgi:cell wall-associated NlpC family hydrolase